MVLQNIVVKKTSKTAANSRRKQTPYKLLRDITSNIDFGKKVRCKKTGKHKPIHCNRNKDVELRFLYRSYWLAQMRNRHYDAHFSREDTFYFAGNGRRNLPYTLLMLDIDCHSFGTLKGAKAFAQHLKDTYFPNLYFEVSTNGNGVHCYVIVEKSRLGAETLNELFGRLQYHLRQELKKHSFDVQDVEVKGTCPVFKWGRRKGELLSYRSGQLAKLPRCLDRFDEFEKTTVIDAYSLFKLRSIPTEAKRQAGSCSGKCFSDEELGRLDGVYLEAAKALLPEGVLKTAGVGRDVAKWVDVAIFLMIGKFFSENMPENGAMPTKRWEKTWTALYKEGDVARPFNSKRFAAIRNHLSSLGLIDWQEERYTLPGYDNLTGEWTKGEATQWRFSPEFMDLLQEEEERASSMVTSTEEVQEFVSSLSKLAPDEVIRPVKHYPSTIPLVDLNDLVPIFDIQTCLAA